MNAETATVVLLMTMISTHLQAAVIRGRWEKVEALKDGYPIVVTMKGWERAKGAFQAVVKTTEVFYEAPNK
jgi:hypothetical protein